jgi:signal transduction histidine kinase
MGSEIHAQIIFLTIYLAMVVYWSNLSEVNIFGLLSVLIGPLLVVIMVSFGEIQHFIWLIFAAIIYVILSTNTRLRRSNERKMKIEKEKTLKSKVALQVADELLEERSKKQVVQAATMHDLKNHFTPVVTNLSYLKGFSPEELVGDKDLLKEVLDDICLSTDKVFNQMKSLSVQSIKSDLSFEIGNVLKGISDFDKLEVASEIPRVKVRGDLGDVQLVFSNCIQNSIQAVDKNPRIKLYFHLVNKDDVKGVSVLLKDNGKGISKEDKKHIFEPGYTTREHGTGVGLFLARRIIESFGGSMTLVDTGLTGTTFEIFLECV